MIDKFIEKSIDLFSDNHIYKRARNGMFCINGEEDKPHPLLESLNNQKKRKSLVMENDIEERRFE